MEEQNPQNPQPSDPPHRPPADLGGGFPPPPPPRGYAPMPYPMPGPPPRTVLNRVGSYFVATILILSILANVYLGLFFVSTFTREAEQTYTEGDADSRIVILPIEGTIDESTYDFVASVLKSLTENPPKALVLRVESGGGGVGASDRIWEKLSQFKKETGVPIVASFGSMAASGGYYVAAMADTIVAEPTCVTGSIGVMAPAFTVEGLLQKIGVTPEVIVATGSPDKDVANNIMRAWTDKDRRKLTVILDSAYDRFVDVVAEGRKSHLTRDQVQQIATGDIYTTQQAIENKLVDLEGYLPKAIDEAAKLAKLTNPRVTIVHPLAGWGALLGVGGHSDPVPASARADQIRRWLIEATTPRLEYRLDILQP